jgi:phosphatidylglycerol:prolipoprotein diacylglycerol transferase
MAIAAAIEIKPFYFVSATIAVALALGFPVTKHLRSSAERRHYYTIQFVTIVGAIIGAKFSVLMGDYQWPWRRFDDWQMILGSGRSITGALIGGFVAAELAKPLIGYTMPPNDRFATVLPFSIGIGRIGCALTGCCLGAPHQGLLSVTYGDGIPRHPAQVYEAIFQFAIGLAFIRMLKRGIMHGRFFNIYLIAYGAFRFATEFLRATPKPFFGFSVYQALSLLMAALGAAFLIARSRAANPFEPSTRAEPQNA